MTEFISTTELLKKMEQYQKIIDDIDFTKLDEKEKKFINYSVQKYFFNNWQLSGKQNAWLNQIRVKGYKS